MIQDAVNAVGAIFPPYSLWPSPDETRVQHLDDGTWQVEIVFTYHPPRPRGLPAPRCLLKLPAPKYPLPVRSHPESAE
jgi:hypothetical protein